MAKLSVNVIARTQTCPHIESFLKHPDGHDHEINLSVTDEYINGDVVIILHYKCELCSVSGRAICSPLDSNEDSEGMDDLTKFHLLQSMQEFKQRLQGLSNVQG